MSTKLKRHRSRHDDLISLILENLARESRVASWVLQAWLSGEHSKIVSAAVNPSGFSDWRDFLDAYQAVSLLKKYPSLELPGVDRKARAMDKFWEAEKVCSSVNVRFCNRAFPDWVLERLHWSRSFIQKALGDFSWDEAVTLADLGPGASIGVKRSVRHPVEKIGKSNPTVTGQALALLEAYRAFDPHLAAASDGFSVVSGCKIATVPKDARSDRVIGIEPQWNMFFQKGIGSMIRKRLCRRGLDLNTGQVRNSELARVGSITNSLATLDLSSASDTISIELVRYLLPADWYTAMAAVRSTHVTVEDRDVILRKFSSMGNGFTFELESLIFWALSLSVCSLLSVGASDVVVYGDDIIVPTAAAGHLVELLDHVGFKTNVEKSFTSGPFRESCGKHYFQGRDVTPLYLRKEISSTSQLLILCNQLRRWAVRRTGGVYSSAIVKEAYETAKSRLPCGVRRLLIPDGYGDGGLISDWDEACPRRAPGQQEGWRARQFLRVPKTSTLDGVPALVYKLWETRKGRCLAGEDTPSLVKDTGSFSMKIKPFIVVRWPVLGPWA